MPVEFFDKKTRLPKLLRSQSDLVSNSKLQIASLPPPLSGQPDLLILAGEHSGDQQAARMVKKLLTQHPDLRIAALAGDALAKAGAQLLFDLTSSSVVGIVEVIRNYRFFRNIMSETIHWIDTYRPKVVCLVDYPGFNLRLAEKLHHLEISKMGGGEVKVVYYISPQIWAWKAKRRFTMARHLDALAVIFPFEVDCYKDTGLKVSFVGHPFVEENYESPVIWNPSGPLLLLPGSRKVAVSRIAPLLFRGYAHYLKEGGKVNAVVLYPSDIIKEILTSALNKFPDLSDKVSLVGQKSLVEASGVLTSSGTMSLSCALAGIPGAIAYKANPITYRLGRILVKIPYLGINNLLLDEAMYPEFIQGAATQKKLATEVFSILESNERLKETQTMTKRLRSILMQSADKDSAG